MKLTKDNFQEYYTKYWDVLTDKNSRILVDDYKAEVKLLPYYDTEPEAKSLIDDFLADVNKYLVPMITKKGDKGGKTDSDEDEAIKLAEARARARMRMVAVVKAKLQLNY